MCLHEFSTTISLKVFPLKSLSNRPYLEWKREEKVLKGFRFSEVDTYDKRFYYTFGSRYLCFSVHVSTSKRFNWQISHGGSVFVQTLQWSSNPFFTNSWKKLNLDEWRWKEGRRDSISRVQLGRGSNVGGRGGGGCHIHESIGHMQLGRSGDAKTTHKTPKTPRKQMVTDGRT